MAGRSFLFDTWSLPLAGEFGDKKTLEVLYRLELGILHSESQGLRHGVDGGLYRPELVGDEVVVLEGGENAKDVFDLLPALPMR